jgi:hypothetical protein
VESDPRYGPLVADLRRLGRSLPPPAGDAASGDPEPRDPAGAMAVAVLTRLADAPRPPQPSPWRRRWRAAVDAAARRRRQALIALVVVLLGCLGVPGVRAAVVDWFGFDGVRVRIGSTPGPSGTSAPPPPTAAAARPSSLAEARGLVSFAPMLLPALGPPAGVEVSADRRVLSLTWTDPDAGTIRLDQFDGRLDYVFAKTSPDVEWTTVNGVSALWFERPHDVVVLDDVGLPRTETARLAGQPLIWETSGTVLRLEGDLTRERALEIARSARPLP